MAMVVPVAAAAQAAAADIANPASCIPAFHDGAGQNPAPSLFVDCNENVMKCSNLLFQPHLCDVR
ncbi:hypothetical protein ACFPLB_15345 [Aquamicrobium segne]|uniref:Secreted protein n=1 Tax=Aquamicrobium segne TaxID=469547 RepID=A0ABW0H1X1_9HYPH